MRDRMDLHQVSLFLLPLNSVVMSLEDGLIEQDKRDIPLFKLWNRD